jgi:tRNA-dihydrouridine synthase
MSCYVLCALIILCSTMASSKRVTTATKSFFEKIGRPKFISAPMVDHSYLPWRLMVRSSGTDLAYTQMMNAGTFARSEKIRNHETDWISHKHASGSNELQQWAKTLDKNTIVQFAGDNLDALVMAAKFVHNDVAAIDLNLGCPQKIAKRGHYGAYLLSERDLVIQLLDGMVSSLSCPVTAKVRVLSNEEDTLELCRAIEGCGVSMLTVHGREITNMKNNIGSADWDIIAKIKQTISIPVIANGGIGSYSDALRCLEYTGVDGVMSSEALLENPKMFSEEGDRRFRTDYARSQLATVREFLQLVEGYADPSRHTDLARPHVLKMLLRFLNGPRNHDLRGTLSNLDYKGACAMVDTLEHRLAAVDFDTEAAEAAGLLGGVGYYQRHRQGAETVRAAQGRVVLDSCSKNKVQGGGTPMRSGVCSISQAAGAVQLEQ